MKDRIEIETTEKPHGWLFHVTIDERRRTSHDITLTKNDYYRLTAGRCTALKLIEKSVKFLLEREPNTAILRSFNLPDIAKYFPEYEAEINKKL